MLAEGLQIPSRKRLLLGIGDDLVRLGEPPGDGQSLQDLHVELPDLRVPREHFKPGDHDLALVGKGKVAEAFPESVIRSAADEWIRVARSEMTWQPQKHLARFQFDDEAGDVPLGQ